MPIRSPRATAAEALSAVPIIIRYMLQRESHSQSELYAVSFLPAGQIHIVYAEKTSPGHIFTPFYHSIIQSKYTHWAVKNQHVILN